MASLLSCSAASAFWPEATDSSLEIGVGYRNDSIKLKREFSPFSSYCGSGSESGSRSELDVNSDLNWKNLNIWFIEARGKYTTCDNIYLRGSADYGWVTGGKLKHTDNFTVGSDYFDDSFSFSDHDKSHIKGNVYDAKLAIGYQFKWCDEALSIAPVVGYSWHGHELRNGHHNDSYDYYDSYSYDSYYSSYSDYSYSDCSGSKNRGHKLNDRWNGFFIGFDLDYRICCDWNVFLDYEYHWAEYHAKEHGHSQLFETNDFGNSYCGCKRYNKSHIHSNNASGNVLDFGVEWDLCDCWTVGLRAEFQWWTARHAHETRKVYESSIGDVEAECAIKIPVKHITWNSGSIVLDLGMAF